MKQHANAPLGPKGRATMVRRYLEQGWSLTEAAEAAGVRGTGIGCFFDDAVHGVLGLKDNDWQSLYHFTIGEPLDDNRLQSFPAYTHLQR